MPSILEQQLYEALKDAIAVTSLIGRSSSDRELFTAIIRAREPWQKAIAVYEEQLSRE